MTSDRPIFNSGVRIKIFTFKKRQRTAHRDALPNFCPAPGSGERKKAAFTLIELLVVIAIIGILSSLLLPALGRVKQKGQGVHCVSNLRQVALGWQLYTTDHGERLPVNACLGSACPTVGENVSNPSWVAGILRTNACPDNTNTEKLVGAAYASSGSIGVYIKNPGVYHCPADISCDPGNARPRVRSIAMNGWVSPGKVNSCNLDYWTTPFKRFLRSSDFTSPVDTFVFVDERPESINDGWFWISTSGYKTNGTIDVSALDYHDLPAVYHNKSSAFSFADGHCETHRWKGGNLLDDADLAWLMTHATMPK